MAKITVTIKLDAPIGKDTISLPEVEVDFESTGVFEKTIDPSTSIPYPLTPADKPPCMVLMIAVDSDGKPPEKGQLTYGEKLPQIAFAPNASDAIKKAQTLEVLRGLPCITNPQLFFNNCGTPFPAIEKVQQLTFWNNGDKRITLRIYRASNPGTA